MNFQIFLPLMVGLFLLIGCNSTKDMTTSPTSNKSDIPGKVMVLLKSSSSATKLEKEMSTYELKSEGQISRTETRFMFSFNPDKISSKKLIKEINALSYASEAAVPQEFKR